MRILVSLATFAAAAALAACGGGESQGTQATGVPPEEWAGDVCTAVGSWLDDFIARSSELESDAQGIASLEDGRTLLTNFLEFTVDRTDELLAEVEGAGQPDVDEGEAIARDFRANVLPLREALVDALERAKNLPVDDPAEFERGATQIGESIETAGADVESAFDDLSSKYESVEFEGDAPAACTELESKTP
jgi:hypothetical protein